MKRKCDLISKQHLLTDLHTLICVNNLDDTPEKQRFFTNFFILIDEQETIKKCFLWWPDK